MPRLFIFYSEINVNIYFWFNLGQESSEGFRRVPHWY